MTLFMGLDLGTQGARCLVTDGQGDVKAAHSVSYTRINIAGEPNQYEQNPADWEQAAFTAIAACVAQVREQGLDPAAIRSVSIDGTSGTIVPLDQNGSPLRAALMYNDMRARDEARTVHEACQDVERRMGLRFNASFSLPRLLWLKNNQPDIYTRPRYFAHQTDYIVGLLCGEFAVSDYSNALKTGYDLVNGCWPAAISDSLGLDPGKLPRIIAPGAPIAPLTSAAAARLGLSTRTMVVGGSTDGYASALAAGANTAGAWASIIGTSFVLKGVTEQLVIDPSGSCYSHRLPSGAWMIGGASNIGGRCLNQNFNPAEFAGFEPQVEAATPTGVVSYPLTGVGERFPFVDPNAAAFFSRPVTGLTLYAALMEGVALAERLTFERMIRIGCPVGDVIYTSGGACRSDSWLRIRASVLNRQLMVPDTVDAAMGSAILAAADHFSSLEEASRHMIHFSKTVDPVAAKVAPYNELYGQFARECRQRYQLGFEP